MLPAFSPSSLLLRHIVFLEVLSRLPLPLIRVTYMHLGKSYLLIVTFISVTDSVFTFSRITDCFDASLHLLCFLSCFFFQVPECTFTLVMIQQNRLHYTGVGMELNKLDKWYQIYDNCVLSIASYDSQDCE